MFNRLSTRFALLYAGLFGAILIVVSLTVFTAISQNAARMVRDELQASGTVFDRIWALRSQQLEESASLLSRDFGFRSAVATNDAATARSALQNLKGRLGIDLALIVGVDGQITTADGRSLGAAGQALYRALDSGGDDASGVFMVGGAPYQAVAAPILTPAPAGWVVFAVRLDRRELGSLEKLSAIPLGAAVFGRRSDGQWSAAGGAAAGPEAQTISRFVTQALAAKADRPRDLKDASGDAIALVKPLHSLSQAQPSVLMLRYPLAQAMAPFTVLIRTLMATGAVGVLLVVIGSFVLAGGLTRPITALDEAARRLKRGEDAVVAVQGHDEIARLAESFNAMAAEIREREDTMRRDAETLAVALDQAQTSNRVTNDFLANMSHEVRTPLNGILGLSQVLAQTVQNDGQRRLVDTVIQSAEALETLLSDILDAAKLRAGQTEIDRAPFALGETVRTAAAAGAAAAAKKQLVFTLDLAPEAELQVVGDAARLSQILDNLISNAVKFTAAGEVRLSLELLDTGSIVPRYRFTVSDTGPGFDPAIKERLFQPFRQADSSATRRHGGTGLGLSISRGLAELMGGTLDGDPRPKGGAAFHLDLPLAPVDAPAAADPVADQAVA